MLRAGHTVKKIMRYEDFNKNTVVGEGDGLPAPLIVAFRTILRRASLKLRVRAKPRNKTKNLILKIRGVMGSLARNIVAKTCKRFRSQIESVATADGSFID